MANHNQALCSITEVSNEQLSEVRHGLAQLLKACVDDDACIGFMHPFYLDEALSYWDKIIAQVREGKRRLLVAQAGPTVVGTVQLVIDMMPNQTHRADVAKLMVLPQSRGQGIAEQLMLEVERVARAHGRSLLVLDTVPGGASERLYARLGWQPVGTIPDYSSRPGGGLAPTTIFYKRLTALLEFSSAPLSSS